MLEFHQSPLPKMRVYLRYVNSNLMYYRICEVLVMSELESETVKDLGI